jgi:hypothetical protein
MIEFILNCIVKLLLVFIGVPIIALVSGLVVALGIIAAVMGYVLFLMYVVIQIVLK